MNAASCSAFMVAVSAWLQPVLLAPASVGLPQLSRQNSQSPTAKWVSQHDVGKMADVCSCCAALGSATRVVAAMPTSWDWLILGRPRLPASLCTVGATGPAHCAGALHKALPQTRCVCCEHVSHLLGPSFVQLTCGCGECVDIGVGVPAAGDHACTLVHTLYIDNVCCWQ
jgi:hypothetical protein